MLWLSMAKWNAPFLNWKILFSCLRVPSGKMTILLCRFWMASSCIWSCLTALCLFCRSMNRVPHNQTPSPNGNIYNKILLITAVPRPITGHKYATTEWKIRMVYKSHRCFHWMDYWPTKSSALWCGATTTTPPSFLSMFSRPRTSYSSPNRLTTTRKPHAVNLRVDLRIEVIAI